MSYIPAKSLLFTLRVCVQAAGTMGKFITKALIEAGFTVTAITREDSTNKLSTEGVQVKKVNYNNKPTIVSALQDQDVLIITMSVFAPPETQNLLVKAAAEANVKWILPNEWGLDPLEEEMQKDISLGRAPKKLHRDYIESLGLNWIAIVSSFWYEFSLGGGSERYGFDFKKKEVVWFDDGYTKIDTSTWPQTALAVAKLLSLKILPEDENDKSVTVSRWRNKPLYISSFNISQREMFDSIVKVTGDKESDWKQTRENVQQRFKDGKEQLEKGDRLGFAKLMYVRVFYPDKAGNYQERRGTDNEALGLPKEDLDEFTKLAAKASDEFAYH